MKGKENGYFTRTHKSMMESASMFASLKSDRPAAKLSKFPNQLEKWDRLSRFLAKKTNRKSDKMTMMNRSNDFVVKQQELRYASNLHEESTQYGSLRWMSELRGPKFGLNPVVVPIGYKWEGNNIFMQLNQPKRNTTEIVTYPDHQELSGTYSSFRTTGYFNELKNQLKKNLVKNLESSTFKGRKLASAGVYDAKQGEIQDPLTKLETRLENMKHIKVEGKEKFPLELTSWLKIPENERMMLVNHQFTEFGEGEPAVHEEVIESEGVKIISHDYSDFD